MTPGQPSKSRGPDTFLPSLFWPHLTFPVCPNKIVSAERNYFFHQLSSLFETPSILPFSAFLLDLNFSVFSLGFHNLAFLLKITGKLLCIISLNLGLSKVDPHDQIQVAHLRQGYHKCDVEIFSLHLIKQHMISFCPPSDGAPFIPYLEWCLPGFSAIK